MSLKEKSLNEESEPTKSALAKAPVLFRAPAHYRQHAHGSINLEGDVFTIKYEQQYMLQKNRLRRLQIPIGEIEHAEYQPRLVGGRLNLRTLFLDTAKQIPWGNNLQITFTIPRSERKHAEDLVTRIEHAIVEQESA